jgi:hypothetical protein
MKISDTVGAIIEDDALTGMEKRSHIFKFLTARGSQAAAAARECLLTTDDERAADYVAQYLELTPDARNEKTRAAERLRKKETLVRSAARLVPWLPDELLMEFVSDYLSQGDPGSPLADVLFTIGLYRPDLVRPYADKLNDDIQRSLLSGAPDVLADALLDRWYEEHDLGLLEALALIRTPHAVELVYSVRGQVPDRSAWETVAALSGLLPDSRKPSGSHPSYMGFVTARGASAHIVGGSQAGEVPLCPECEAPTELVLKLAAKDLPYDLSNDPPFFWFSCDCMAADDVVVRVRSDSVEALNLPGGSPVTGLGILLGGERSMTLEEHPNQTGVSDEALPGESLHQVGGLPRWVEIDRHPKCPDCEVYMPFLAAIGGGPTIFGDLPFEGYLYGFWCDSCQVSHSMFQS